jgi:hypothetical protein
VFLKAPNYVACPQCNLVRDGDAPPTPCPQCAMWANLARIADALEAMARPKDAPVLCVCCRAMAIGRESIVSTPRGAVCVWCVRDCGEGHICERLVERARRAGLV